MPHEADVVSFSEAPLDRLDQHHLGREVLQRRTRQWRCLCIDQQTATLQRSAKQVGVQFDVVFEIILLFPLLDLVQRRLCDVDVTTFDQLRHLPVEEGQQQGADVRAVHIRVGHDDNAVIPQFVGIEFLPTDPATHRGDQRAHLDRGQHLVETGLLDVQNLALQREDRLGTSISALFRGATGGITLDQVEFRERRILFLTVGQFARQSGHIEHAFATRHFSRLARRFARARGLDHLPGDRLGLCRILCKEIVQVLDQKRLDHAFHLRRNEFVLGL